MFSALIVDHCDLDEKWTVECPDAVSKPIFNTAGLPQCKLDAAIREGSLTLNAFKDTLTFDGFTSPYITITATDP